VNVKSYLIRLFVKAPPAQLTRNGLTGAGTPPPPLPPPPPPPPGPPAKVVAVIDRAITKVIKLGLAQLRIVLRSRISCFLLRK
jgi:hypothetical protein